MNLREVNRQTQNDQAYQKDNSGPFSIWIQKVINKETNRREFISPYKIGKLICARYDEVIEITRETSRKVEVVMKTGEAANKLKNDEELLKENLEVTIPPFRLSRRGVIRDVDSDITEDEIIKYAESTANVVSAKRIFKRSWANNQNENPLIPTRTVIITFEGQVLPAELTLFKIKSDVKPYIATPMFCYKCHKPGHSGKFCRVESKCRKCGAQSHKVDQCPEVKPKCVNCQKEHFSNDKQCIVYLREKEVRRLMAWENISLNNAKKLVYQSQGPVLNKENFPNLSRGQNYKKFSEVVKTKKDEISGRELKTKLNEVELASSCENVNKPKDLSDERTTAEEEEAAKIIMELSQGEIFMDNNTVTKSIKNTRQYGPSTRSTTENSKKTNTTNKFNSGSESIFKTDWDKNIKKVVTNNSLRIQSQKPPRNGASTSQSHALIR